LKQALQAMEDKKWHNGNEMVSSKLCNCNLMENVKEQTVGNKI
jgi:hypothetical protein